MSIFNQTILLLVGFLVLWQASYFAVKSAIEICLVYRVKSFIIGFFVFSISTGLPEIISAIVSSIQGVPELSAGNLLGASFVNISLILGVTLILAGTIRINSKLKKQLIRTLLLLIFVYIGLISLSQMHRIIGLLLLILYLSSLLWLHLGIAKEDAFQDTEESREKIHQLKKNTVLPLKAYVLIKFFSSLALLTVGSWITVQAASHVADLLNIHLSIFGATLIAVSTAIPELILEIQAVRQKEYALALGDIFGSSLVNVTLILGLLVIISPHVILSFGIVILPFFLIGSGVIIRGLIKKNSLTSQEGKILIVLFVLFIMTAIGYEQFYHVA